MSKRMLREAVLFPHFADQDCISFLNRHDLTEKERHISDEATVSYAMIYDAM